jgi:hypothetical protein
MKEYFVSLGNLVWLGFKNTLIMKNHLVNSIVYDTVLFSIYFFMPQMDKGWNLQGTLVPQFKHNMALVATLILSSSIVFITAFINYHESNKLFVLSSIIKGYLSIARTGFGILTLATLLLGRVYSAVIIVFTFYFIIHYLYILIDTSLEKNKE